jgi:diguanylate cyclase (GGDEF)-like protein
VDHPESDTEAKDLVENLVDMIRNSVAEILKLQPIESLLEGIISEGLELVDADAGGVYLYRKEKNLLEWVVAKGENVAPVGTTLDIEEGVSGETFRSRTTLVIDDYSRYTHRSDKWPGVSASVVSTPIQVNDEIIGILNIRKDRTRAFTPGDILLTELFASQAAVALRNNFLYEERAAMEKQLHHRATHDDLTELPNRSLLTDRLETAIRRAERNGTLIGILFLDVDNFKNVNDALGHPRGDELLKGIAERLSSCIRGPDTLARLGGDEFVCLLDAVGSVSDVLHIIERIFEALDSTFEIGNSLIKVTASIGVSLYPQDGRAYSDLIKNADTALYQAKKRAGNQYHFFTPRLQVEIERRVLLEEHLRQALEKGELSLLYQPKTSLGENRCSGAEALLRWSSPVLGAVSPGVFVPLAEDLGIIRDIEAWVLQRAIGEINEVRRKTGKPIPVSVNISAKHFQEVGFPREVGDTLNRMELDASGLCIEITEGTLIQNQLQVVQNIKKLHRLGVRLSIDDFGTGYSSLSYLSKFPVNELKIDKSFIDPLPEKKENVSIVQAIIAVGKSLGFSVVSEGVETEDQVGILRKLGCDEIQGYYYSKPLLPEHLIEYLLKTTNT